METGMITTTTATPATTTSTATPGGALDKNSFL